MKKLVLFLFISLSLTAAVRAGEVKFDSAVVYLTAPEFTLPLRINSVNNLYGAALDLVYDTNLLELQDLDNDSSNGINPKVLEGGILNQAGIDSTVLMKGLEDKKEGKLVTGLVRDGITGINVNAEGVLLSIGFRAKNSGIANLVFDSAALKDPNNSTIAASWLNGNVTIYSSPADIEAVPSTYSLVLAQACDTSRALLIKNNGGEPLRFTLTDSTDWLTENITSGTIAKEDSTLINLNFAASVLPYGLHTAQIEISSNDPDNSLVTISVSLLINTPPVVTISAVPSSGIVPLSVNFTATAVDPDGYIANYNWDFNGDNYFDTTTLTNTITHNYSTTGNFIAKVRVTDNGGLSAEDEVLVNALQGISISSVTPNSGLNDTTTNVTIHGTNFDTSCKVYAGTGDSCIVGSVDTPGHAYKVFGSEYYAYVADYDSGLAIIDISNPNVPYIAGRVMLSDTTLGVYVRGNYAYIANGNAGLKVIDISKPANPVVVGSVDTPGYATGIYVLFGARADGVYGAKYAYVADGNAGLQIIDLINLSNPVIVGSVDTPGYAANVYVTNYAYVADGEYGLQVINISDPANPIIVGSVDTPGYAVSVYVIANTAYVADGTAGLQIINLNNPANPIIVGSVDTPGYAEDVNIPVYTPGTAGTNLENYAYVADREYGLQVIETSNPEKPVIINKINFSDYVCGASLGYFSGNYTYIYATNWNSGLKLVNRLSAGNDVSNVLFIDPTSVQFINDTTLIARIPKGLRPGIYNIKVTKSDGGEAVLNNSFTAIKAPNLPPVAEAGTNKWVNEYNLVTHNGSQSYDTDGVIASYFWNFGDGTPTIKAYNQATHTYDTSGTYIIKLTAIDDDDAVSSDTASAFVSNYIKRVNCGGNGYSDSSGNWWNSDANMIYNSYDIYGWGWVGGTTDSTSDAIDNTLFDPLYQKCRKNMSAYRFYVPNGNYDVTLRFAEIKKTAIGSRVFNVSIEGNLVLPNFDIYAEAGHDRALDKLFNVNVTDGRLDIDFGQITDYAIINAIYIKRN